MGGEHRGVGAALTVIAGLMPARLTPAGRVVTGPRLRDTAPRARRPRAARALRRVIEVCVPHSSTNTNRAGSTPPSCARHRVRAVSSRSVAVRLVASPAARPGSAAPRARAAGRRSPATSTPATPAGRRRRRTPPRARQRGIGRGGQPSGQPGLQLPPHRRHRPVPLFGRRQAAGRPAAGQVALHGPQRHPEPLRRLRLAHPRIDCGHHPLTQIHRVRPHTGRHTPANRQPSTNKHTAVRRRASTRTGRRR